jgi:hypothetical protein
MRFVYQFMNRNSKGIQKVLASLTMIATVMSLSGFAVLAPTAAALAVAPADYGLKEGDVISASGTNDPDVYIVNDWGYKRLFVNPAIFNLYGHLGWSKVKSVSATTRDAFGTSGLFRNCETGDQKVYGLEVVSEDVANLRWVNTSGAQAVADDANFFKKVFCINSAEQALYGMGAQYTSVTQVPAYTRGGTTPVTGGSLSASLSSDNPSANTLIAGQAAGDLAHFTFTGNGTVTALTLTRIGVSADTTLSNVYLYSGTKRLTDAATVSQGKISFNDSVGLFTVNGSANISVKADVAASTGGQTVGVQLSGFTVGGAVSASTLSGNLMTIASAPSDFGTLALNSTTTPSAGTIDPQNDYIMWQNTVSVTNHDLWLKSLQLRVIGSVAVGDLQNFRLQVDGVQVGSAIAQTDANGYIVFDLSASPFTLKTGSRVVKVLGNVVGGSNKNFFLSLRQKSDIFTVESQYGQPVLASGTTPASAGQQDVSSGSLTITKMTDSPSGDIVKDSSSVTLGKFEFRANGEKMKVENLRVAFAGSTALAGDSLRNGAIFADGVQIGSTQTLFEDTASGSVNTLGYTEYSLGSSLIVNPGTPRIIEIRADVYDNSAGTNDVSANTTIQAVIAAGSSNVQRLTSLNYVSSPNATTVTGNTLTVKTGSFSGAKYTGYANQSVVSPKTGFKIGHFTLTANTAEDVQVSAINLDVNPVSTFTAAKLLNTYLKIWSDTGTLVATTAPKSTVSSTASNSYSVNFTIPKNKTFQVEVISNIDSGITATHTLTVDMDATGLTTSSATSASTTEVIGQTITAQSGSLTLANGSSPAARLIQGGQSPSVYAFTLQPQYDDFVLDNATFKLGSTLASATGAVGMLKLYDGTTLVGSSPMTTTSSAAFAMTGLNYPLSQASGTKTLTAVVDLANVGVGGNDTGGPVQVQISSLKYHDSNGNVTTSVVDPSTYTGNSMTVVKSYPTFTNVTLPSNVLAVGTQTLFKTQISAVGGPVSWRKVVFTIAVTNVPTINTFQLFENGSEITTLASPTYSQLSTGHYYATASRDFNVAAAASSGKVIWQFNSDRVIPAGGSITLELRGNVGGSIVAGQSISTQIGNPNGSTFAASDDVVALGGTAASGWRSDVDPTFLWSDQSSAAHASTTDDWMGDALIQGLSQSEVLFQ